MLIQTSSCKAFLTDELNRRLKANPRYSLRAFAKNLGISAGELSEILRDRRQLSLKSALRIAKAMGLSTAESQHLLELVQLEKANQLGQAEILKQRSSELKSLQVSIDHFQIISEWYHFAIVNLFDCQGFTPQSSIISKKLGISITEARSALERLERTGILKRGVNRELIVASDYVLTPTDIPSEAIRSNHKQILSKAIEALDLQQIDEREFTGIGIALSRSEIPLLKKKISDFVDQIATDFGKGKNKTSVYQLECVLFRLSQPILETQEKSQ